MRNVQDTSSVSERSTSNSPLVTDWNDVDALQREILHLRDELIGAEAQLGELRARLRVEAERRRFDQQSREVSDLEHVLTVNADLEQQLADLRTSTTWRLGRAMIRPLSLLQRPTGSELPGAGSTGR